MPDQALPGARQKARLRRRIQQPARAEVEAEKVLVEVPPRAPPRSLARHEHHRSPSPGLHGRQQRGRCAGRTTSGAGSPSLPTHGRRENHPRPWRLSTCKRALTLPGFSPEPGRFSTRTATATSNSAATGAPRANCASSGCSDGGRETDSETPAGFFLRLRPRPCIMRNDATWHKGGGQPGAVDSLIRRLLTGTGINLETCTSPTGHQDGTTHRVSG